MPNINFFETPHAAGPARFDVPARSLRDRIRDQSVDEPHPRQRPRCRLAPVADVARHARWTERHDRGTAAAARPARPRLHRQCRAHVPGPILLLAASSTTCVRSESPYFDAWFRDHGFEVEHLPDGMFHEGAGDALFCGDALFAGYRTRSDVCAPPVGREPDRRPRAAAGTGQSALLSPRHLLLSAGARRGALLPRRVRRLRPARARRPTFPS